MAQVFMVLSKRIVGAMEKNRRCSAKESTMLRGSSQYTLRYHLTATQRKVTKRDTNRMQSLFFTCAFVKFSVDISQAIKQSLKNQVKMLVF